MALLRCKHRGFVGVILVAWRSYSGQLLRDTTDQAGVHGSSSFNEICGLSLLTIKVWMVKGYR
jgi:hypothetical protein